MRSSSFQFLGLAVALPASVCLVSVACSSTSATGSSGAATASGSASAATGSGGASASSSSGTGGGVVPPGPVARHSSSIAVSPDGTTVYVVNADTDSVSQIDTTTHMLVREIPLAPSPPVV